MSDDFLRQAYDGLTASNQEARAALLLATNALERMDALLAAFVAPEEPPEASEDDSEPSSPLRDKILDPEGDLEVEPDDGSPLLFG